MFIKKSAKCPVVVLSEGVNVGCTVGTTAAVDIVRTVKQHKSGFCCMHIRKVNYAQRCLCVRLLENTWRLIRSCS
ncbi:hypothetical protein F7725_009215 [Dissostichus mawsoni]|uniref:Uncharacterized protein n=1 Tax=Dissostichus mawsoni TaxID=36200 RepID=A0A7J5Z6T2_DISMA|nr:hypothetical protein F7725_009215 [Dissostichus mawsoni]